MFVNHSVIIDLLKPAPVVLQAVQDDSTHVINLQLRENGNTYHVKADAAGATIVGVIAYQTAGHVSGEYDTIRGEDAVQVVTSGNTEDDSAWTCYIDGAVFATPGFARVTIRFMTEDGLYLHAFPIDFYVSASGCGIQEPSEHTEMQSLGTLAAAVSELQTALASVSASSPLRVNVSGDYGQTGEMYDLSADKTYAEIYTAVNSGRYVYAVFSNTVIPLAMWNNNAVVFQLFVCTDGGAPTSSYLNCVISIASNNAISGKYQDQL